MIAWGKKYDLPLRHEDVAGDVKPLDEQKLQVLVGYLSVSTSIYNDVNSRIGLDLHQPYDCAERCVELLTHFGGSVNRARHPPSRQKPGIMWRVKGRKAAQAGSILLRVPSFRQSQFEYLANFFENGDDSRQFRLPELHVPDDICFSPTLEFCCGMFDATGSVLMTAVAGLELNFAHRSKAVANAMVLVFESHDIPSQLYFDRVDSRWKFKVRKTGDVLAALRLMLPFLARKRQVAEMVLAHADELLNSTRADMQARTLLREKMTPFQVRRHGMARHGVEGMERSLEMQRNFVRRWRGRNKNKDISSVEQELQKQKEDHWFKTRVHETEKCRESIRDLLSRGAYVTKPKWNQPHFPAQH